MAKAGQPTKYRRDFHNSDFIRLSKQGKNITQIALDWDVDRATIYEWAKRHKEFSDTLKKGRSFAEGWYTNLGQLAMLGEATVNGRKIKVDIGMFVWLTKNLFKWSDKMNVEARSPEIENRPLKHLSDEEIDKL
jgi:transposase-like protein